MPASRGLSERHQTIKAITTLTDLNAKLEILRKLAHERKAPKYEEKSVHVYEYQLIDSPSWLILFTAGIEFEEAERGLRDRFRERFITIKQRG